ncbi:MAG: RibD family protein, partial [Acidimicrobiia bacterium]|nr:RibD family protein [Acidimicrobiia bacterium]
MRPTVILKVALTLDGQMAAADGSSQWISSPEARQDAHRLRARVDAVMVGAGTLRADN